MTTFRRQVAQWIYARRLSSIVCIWVVFKAAFTIIHGSDTLTIAFIDVVPSIMSDATISTAAFDQTLPPSDEPRAASPVKPKSQSTTTRPNANDFLCKKPRKSPVFQQIQIANSSRTSPSIICFIMSHSKSTTKINAVQKTWGLCCSLLRMKLTLLLEQSKWIQTQVILGYGPNWMKLWPTFGRSLDQINLIGT